MDQAEKDAREIVCKYAGVGHWELVEDVINEHGHLKNMITTALRARDEEIAGLRQQVVARTQERNTVAAERDHVREELKDSREWAESQKHSANGWNAAWKEKCTDADQLREEIARLKAENMTLTLNDKGDLLQQVRLMTKGFHEASAERDACVEALEFYARIEAFTPNSTEPRRLRKAKEALARLPDAAERARLVEAVLEDARDVSADWQVATSIAALDAHDAKAKQGAGGGG